MEMLEAFGFRERANGCIVVVCPDQHVAHVLRLDAYADLCSLFGGFMTRSGGDGVRSGLGVGATECCVAGEA